MKKLIILSLLLPFYSNAQVTVGWDVSCDYDESDTVGQIQQAFDDGATEIRVTNQQEFVMPVIIDDDIVIKGGYNSCADASADNQSTTSTVMNGNTLSQAILKIDTNSAVRNISFDNFELKNVSNSNDRAGGVTIYNSSGTINLSRLNINSNTDNSVGGLSIFQDGFFVGSALQVNVVDSLVLNNSSTFGAGGIDCTNDTSSPIQMSISGDSGVSFNHSDSHGGGIKLSNCDLILSSGTSNPSLENPLGIHANTANGDGGGLAILNGSVATLTGNQNNPVNITSNTSNFDDVSSGDGGGIIVNGNSAIDQSTLNATNILIASNTSNNKTGGALFVEYDAVANISNNLRGCGWSQFCSLIENNSAKDGGAVGIEERGSVTIVGTEIMSNRSVSAGSVAYIRDDDSSITIEGSLIHHNGGADHTEFFDSYLIRNSFGNNTITVAYSTIVDNQAQFASILSHNGTGGNLQLFGSIIDDPGVAAVSVAPTAILGTADCNILANDSSITNLPVSNNIFETTPAFIDRMNQDYHLDPSLTVGIDRCEASIYTIISDDIDGDLRGFDHPDFVNDTGLYDIGVDEVEFDIIFINGFE